jgi:hypothetical protein
LSPRTAMFRNEISETVGLGSYKVLTDIRLALNHA